MAGMTHRERVLAALNHEEPDRVPRDLGQGTATAINSLSTIPLTPFLPRKGEEIISEGHPQTPGKGASPLCTPHISAAC